MGRKHNIEEAIRSLSNKHDIKIDVNKKLFISSRILFIRKDKKNIKS